MAHAFFCVQSLLKFLSGLFRFRFGSLSFGLDFCLSLLGVLDLTGEVVNLAIFVT